MKKNLALNPNAETVHGRKQIYTDLVISAHQDDIEIMCPQGILKGYQSDKFGLVAVVAADGSGSPRAGEYASFSDEEMKKVRRLEQIEAAKKGDYSELIMLNYPSARLKNNSDSAPTEDIAGILSYYRPETVYIHNLADKHPTHVAVAVRSVKAVRSLPREMRPKKLYGCEVWRGLDWLPDREKVVFDVTGAGELIDSLISAFRSQVLGGKRYDLASRGRRFANATFGESHGVDKAAEVAYAMDLTPLIQDDDIDIKAFITAAVERFRDEILA